MTRVLAVWCPDWPVTAAGGSPDVPGAVLQGNRVVACSAAARIEGVRRGQRRRDAQSRCPELVVYSHDQGREARLFEPIAVAVETVVPGIEILRPGLLVVAARGAARYYQGELPLLATMATTVVDATGHDVQQGIADGAFAATQAAYAARVVPVGGAADFLAPLPIRVLDRPELADLLIRLGIHTLGDFAALPRADVLARFGPDGAYVHDLAHGIEVRPPAARVAPPELAVELVLDPPVDRVDTATFVAKSLAGQLHERLAARGLACIRISIEACTESGEQLSRSWRHGSISTTGFTATAIADRTRWQLDGWLSGTIRSHDGRPSSGVAFLRLVPDEVIYDDGRQLSLWGQEKQGGQEKLGGYEAAGTFGTELEQIDRALARVQGILGPDAVVTAMVGAGRDVAEQIRLVSWGEPREVEPADACPWPGRLPAPSPATVLLTPQAATVTDAEGIAVTVTGRCAVSTAPAWVQIGPQPPVAVAGWAGPWPLDVRWWDRLTARRRARFQIATVDGVGLLLVCENSRWSVEALYD